MAAFEGADVDGLDRLAQEFAQAAQVVDEVKMACEVIVAAASIFGPFGAAFVAYLKGVVIPWLTRIAEALQLMAKVLSVHSQAQRSASSSATSLPSYSFPASSAPAASTANYPLLAIAALGPVGLAASALTSTAPSGATVSTPNALGESGGGTTGELAGPGDKPVVPGTVELSKSFGAVMDKDALEDFEGKESSLFHPTIGTQIDGSVAAFTTQGEHYQVSAIEATGAAGAWAGYDPKDGYQLGAGAEGGLNLVDVKVAGDVPLGAAGSLGLANQTTVGVNGEAQAGVGYNPSTQTVSAGASASAFAGVQNTTTVEWKTDYFSDRTDITGQLGAGAAANANVELGPGHLVISEGAGVTVGAGGTISNSLDVNYGAIYNDVSKGVSDGVTELSNDATAVGQYLQRIQIAPYAPGAY
ncbi:MAG: hypothetical protein J0H43_05195 [Actinobacteria bacterium]|nr:hypothetical protein [Actinomycetota bacterium]